MLRKTCIFKCCILALSVCTWVSECMYKLSLLVFLSHTLCTCWRRLCHVRWFFYVVDLAASIVRFVLFQCYCWIFRTRQVARLWRRSCVVSIKPSVRDCEGMLLTGRHLVVAAGGVDLPFDRTDVATSHRPLADVRACASLVVVTTSHIASTVTVAPTPTFRRPLTVL